MIKDLAVVASITFAAMMGPGPDMILIIRNSARERLSYVILCSLGICFGLMIHIGLAIIGIAALVAASEVMFSAVKFAGSLYLIYLGIRSLTSQTDILQDTQKSVSQLREAFRSGFLCNLLNPKVTVFILAMFTQVIAPDSPVSLKLTVGALIICESFIVWNTFAVLMRTLLPSMRTPRFARILNRISGSLLIIFGILLAFAQMQ